MSTVTAIVIAIATATRSFWRVGEEIMLNYFRKTTAATMRVSLVASQLLAAIGAANLASNPSLVVARSIERPLVLAPAAGAITGTVFNDANGNGAREGTELGVLGIAVTAFSNGTSTSTTTDSSGAYTLTVTGNDARIEFTGLAGYQSSPVGADSNTSVRFVTSPAANVNLGIFRPTEFCQNNPNLLVSCFVTGNNLTGDGKDSRTVLSYPYNAAGIAASLQVTEALARQVGSVYGVGYHRFSKFVFVSSYTKRLAGYGPGTGNATSDGTGTIYMFKAGAPTDAVPFVDLDDLFGANTTGSTPHSDFAIKLGDYEKNAFAAVGKIGLGDIDVSEDDRTLWVVNLANQTLYGLPITLNGAQTPIAPAAAQVSSKLIPNPGCINGVGRPFGVKPYNGLVYVGGVCTAENLAPTAGITNDLQAYVYAFNPSTNSWAGPVLQFPLNYTRHCVDIYSSYPTECKPGVNGSLASWQPWRDTLETTFPNGFAEGFVANPEPMLSDIEFVPSNGGPGGDMVIAFRDRYADQVGYDDPGPENTAPRGYNLKALPGGDVLRAGLNAGGTWTIENNAQSNPAGRFGPSTGANSGEGPGGGEFYMGEELFGVHDESALGALAFSPNFTSIVATAVDPIQAVSAGTIQMDNQTGGQTRAYEVYVPPPSADSQFNFRKTNGLGDIELLCDAAPIEIGNRVWKDANGNGIQDPGELPLANIQVRLTDSLGNSVTVTTDGNGEYRFSNATGANTASAIYGLNTGNAGSVSLTPFSVYTLTIDLAQGNLSTLLPTTPNADPSANGTARDSNGVQTGNAVNAAVVLGGPGFNNHTYDFGFKDLPVATASLGNYVWLDVNHDGIQNEPAANGQNNITVTLRLAADNSVVGTQTTHDDALGNRGYYTFTNLAPGNYIVCFTAPSNAVFTTADQGTNDAQDSDANTSTGCTISIALASGEVNPTIDAGLFQPNPAIVLKKYTNGFDADTITGPQLIVGTVVTWTYVITNIGNVDLIGITLTDDIEGGVTGAKTDLAVGESMTRTKTGIVTAGQYTNTGTVTGTSSFDRETQVTSTDPSHYFGIALASLGNYVWEDANYDGVQNEPAANGRNGITVTLRNAADNSIVGVQTTHDDIFGNDGYYTFTGLLPGNYIVCFTPPPGYIITKQGQGGNGSTDSDANANTTCTVSITLASGEVNPNIDAGLFQANPQIKLTKYTNGEDADTPTGPLVSVGSVVTWTYLFTNTGNITLTNVFVTDDIVGAICNGFSLAPGQSQLCTKTGIATAGQYTNTGTVTGTNQLNPAQQVTSTNPSHYFGMEPKIVLKKYTNGFDADVPTGPGLPIGSVVTWTYVVTNTGNVVLQSIVLTDDKIGTITCPKTTLIVGETMTCTATGIAAVGQYANTGVVTGTNQLNPAQKVTSTDPSHYFGTNQPVASLGNFVWRDADRDGQQDAGEPGIPGITVTLRNVTGTVIATAHTDASGFYSFTNLLPGSYSVCFGLPPGMVLTGQGGDPNSDTDSNADPLTGCTALVTLAPGQNNPTIDTGVVVFTPSIKLTKYTNGFDADLPPGPTVLIGSVVTWTYLITNTGDVTLTTVTLSDDKIGGITCPKTVLAPNEIMTCTKTGIAVAGQYVNTAVVTGTNALATTERVTSTNPSHYFAAGPTLVIRKDSVPPTSSLVKSGDLITYTLRVTNTGNLTATNVVIDDPLPTDTTYIVGSALPGLASGPTPLVWNMGALGPGQTTSVRFTVRVNDQVVGTAILNQGGVKSTEIERIPSNQTVHPYTNTAVSLIHFGLTAEDGGLRVTWTTGSELDSFGFAIYRSTNAEGANKVRVTGEWVAARGGNSTYSVLDTGANKANRYYYWLQEVERSGNILDYGPAVWAASAAQSVAVNANVGVVAGGVPVVVPALQPVGQQNTGEMSVSALGAATQSQSSVDVLAQPVAERVVAPVDAEEISRASRANTVAAQPASVPEAKLQVQSVQAASSVSEVTPKDVQPANTAATVNEVNVERAGQSTLPSYQSKTKVETVLTMPTSEARAIALLGALLVLAVSGIAYRVVRRRRL